MITHDRYQTSVYVGMLGVWTVSITAVAVLPDRTIYRPSTAAGPDAYRPGAVGGPSAYRPLSVGLPPLYRPTNPSTPAG